MTGTAAKTQTATAETMAAWLTSNGFRFEGTRGECDTACYRKGMIRVAIEDEASIAIYVFDTRYPRADVLAWDARFNSAPLAMVASAVNTALDTVRAALLPEN
jgi:hypothetical protein